MPIPSPSLGRRAVLGAAAAPAALAAFGSPAGAQPTVTQAVAAAPPPPEVTRIMAGHMLDTVPGDIPAAARKEAVRSILNYVGCAVGGSQHETSGRAIAALAEFSGPPRATVMGTRERLDALHAALVNGIDSHVFDYDDTHLRTIIHPAGVVASALFALAEHRPGTISGADFVTAFILGVEMECRLGNSVFPAHYEAGWHITGTCGVFGAAAATGRILKLDQQQMTWALGIAATQSAGLKEMFGTMCKSFHPGAAAQNGLKAALLAAKGFDSSERGIEAVPYGWAHVLSTERNYGELLDDWGGSWQINLNTYKPFPCGIVEHPVIDACIQLRREHGLTPDRIAEVDVRGNPQLQKLTGKMTPATGLESKFSIYHSAAIALVRGKAGMQEYTDAAAKDPAVVALRGRVKLLIDPQVKEDEAYVTVVTTDGQRFDKHVEHAIGSLDRPMSDADLEEKFSGLAEGVLPENQMKRLIALCWGIEAQDDAGAIPRASALA